MNLSHYLLIKKSLYSRKPQENDIVVEEVMRWIHDSLGLPLNGICRFTNDTIKCRCKGFFIPR